MCSLEDVSPLQLRSLLRRNASGLFILGHMCWGYIVGKTSSSLLGVRINPYLILILAALPDIDLLLGAAGIQHRTWTHSVLVWSLIFVPFFVMYRTRSIPYFIAPIQHILFGDVVVGTSNRALWPLSRFDFALGHGLLSIENIALEGLGLAIFLFLMFATKSGRADFFSKENKSPRRVLSMLLSIAPLVAFVLFIYSFDWIANLLVDSGILKASRLLDSAPIIVGNELFPYAIVMHIVLICALAVPLIWTFTARTKTMPADTKF